MSHNTTIDEVVFTDIEALKAAVKDLNKAGVRATLLQNVEPRSYRAGQLPVAPYVLRLEDGQYDVGFYMNKEKKGYEAKTDFYSDHVKKQLGAKTNANESHAQGHMGKLFHAYGVQAATRQAAKQGYSVRRVNKPDGTVQLIMTGMGG